MILTLVRLDTDPINGTIGALKIDGVPVCWALEPFMYGNAPKHSAIPAQVYPIEPYESQRYGSTWEVTNVYGREYILFHAGNTIADTEGCILPGISLGAIDGLRAVMNSRLAMDIIKKALAGDITHKLIIREVF